MAGSRDGAFRGRDSGRSAGRTPGPADLVLRGGKIVTVDDARPEAQALAVVGDTIAAVGSNQDIQPYIGAEHACHRAERRARGSRLHRRSRAFHRRRPGRTEPEARDAKDWDEIVRMVGEAAKKARPGEWILGRGWHQEKWSRRPAPSVEGFPVHDALEPGVAAEPGLADPRQRPRRLRQRQSDGAGRCRRSRRRIRRGGAILQDAGWRSDRRCSTRRPSRSSPAALARDRAKRTPAEVEADLRKDIELAAAESLSKG